jgi:hypothetical protein
VAEIEDQQHLDRPPSDPFDLGEPLDDGLGIETIESVARRNPAGLLVPCEIPDGAGLGGGETDRPQVRLARRQHLLG